MDLYTIFSIIAVFVVVGLIVWLVNKYLPMDRRFKDVMNVVVLVAVVLWALWVLAGNWLPRIGN